MDAMEMIPNRNEYKAGRMEGGGEIMRCTRMRLYADAFNNYYASLNDDHLLGLSR